MQPRHAALPAVLGSFVIHLSPVPVHGGVTAVGSLIWQESGSTLGPIGWLLAMGAAVLVFQAMLGILIYWTLRRPSRSRVVLFLISLPALAILLVVVIFTIGWARFSLAGVMSDAKFQSPIYSIIRS